MGESARVGSREDPLGKVRALPGKVVKLGRYEVAIRTTGRYLGSGQVAAPSKAFRHPTEPVHIDFEVRTFT